MRARRLAIALAGAILISPAIPAIPAPAPTCSFSTTQLMSDKTWEARLTGETCGACGPVTGRIKWADGTVGESQTQTGPNVDFVWSHTFPAAGVYHVRADFDDARGRRCAGESTISVN
jgi:hypothetical protein